MKKMETSSSLFPVAYEQMNISAHDTLHNMINVMNVVSLGDKHMMNVSAANGYL